MKNIIEAAKWIVPRGIKRRVKQGLIDYFQVPTAEWSLANMRRLGFSPAIIADVGAYKGEWTTAIHPVFPEAKILMLEAQETRRPDLEAVKQALGARVDYHVSLLGAETRDDVVFNTYPNAPTGSSMLADWRGSETVKVKCRMRTLDDIFAEKGLSRVELIKLDVQGYELEVLKGARQTLKGVQAILMEVSFIDMYQKNPLIYDVVTFMREHGFQAYDICGLMRRPLDMALAQIDMIFVPEKSPLLRNKQYGIGDAI